jgi:hypothetical protein
MVSSHVGKWSSCKLGLFRPESPFWFKNGANHTPIPLFADSVKQVSYGPPDLLRQSIYSRLAGYEDVNDAERLSQDPTFRLIGSELDTAMKLAFELTLC